MQVIRVYFTSNSTEYNKAGAAGSSSMCVGLLGLGVWRCGALASKEAWPHESGPPPSPSKQASILFATGFAPLALAPYIPAANSQPTLYISEYLIFVRQYK